MLIVAKKTKTIGQAWVIAALVNIALNIILVQRFGIMGAAITSFTVYLLVSVVLTYFAMKIVTLQIEWLFIFKCLGASVIMAMFLWWLDGEKIMNTVLIVVAGVVLYGVLLIAFKSFTRQRWLFFKGLIIRG